MVQRSYRRKQHKRRFSRHRSLVRGGTHWTRRYLDHAGNFFSYPFKYAYHNHPFRRNKSKSAAHPDLANPASSKQTDIASPVSPQQTETVPSNQDEAEHQDSSEEGIIPRYLSLFGNKKAREKATDVSKKPQDKATIIEKKRNLTENLNKFRSPNSHVTTGSVVTQNFSKNIATGEKLAHNTENLKEALKKFADNTHEEKKRLEKNNSSGIYGFMDKALPGVFSTRSNGGKRRRKTRRR